MLRLRGIAHLVNLLLNNTLQLVDHLQVLLQRVLIHTPDLLFLLLDISHLLVELLLEALHLIQVLRCHALIFLQLVTELLHFVILCLNLFQNRLRQLLRLRLLLAVAVVGVHHKLIDHCQGL